MQTIEEPYLDLYGALKLTALTERHLGVTIPKKEREKLVEDLQETALPTGEVFDAEIPYSKIVVKQSFPQGLQEHHIYVRHFLNTNPLSHKSKKTTSRPTRSKSTKDYINRVLESTSDDNEKKEKTLIGMMEGDWEEERVAILGRITTYTRINAKTIEEVVEERPKRKTVIHTIPATAYRLRGPCGVIARWEGASAVYEWEKQHWIPVMYVAGLPVKSISIDDYVRVINELKTPLREEEKKK